MLHFLTTTDIVVWPSASFCRVGWSVVLPLPSCVGSGSRAYLIRLEHTFSCLQR